MITNESLEMELSTLRAKSKEKHKELQATLKVNEVAAQVSELPDTSVRILQTDWPGASGDPKGDDLG